MNIGLKMAVRFLYSMMIVKLTVKCNKSKGKAELIFIKASVLIGLFQNSKISA